MGFYNPAKGRTILQFYLMAGVINMQSFMLLNLLLHDEAM